MHDRETLTLGRLSQAHIQGDEGERLRLILGHRERSSELQRIGRSQWVDAKQAHGGLADTRHRLDLPP